MPTLVFMGTPEFALPTLLQLHRSKLCAVVGAVTQPDGAAGRGRKLTASPVKQAALELGLPVITPRRLQEPEAMAQLRAWAPELIMVAAFGQLLRPDALDLPRFGCLNLHASPLPRHRGAAPIPSAILAGDAETGVTIMKMDSGLDTGPILAARAVPILPDDTTASLTPRLAELGAELLMETLPGYLAGDLTPTPQDGARATYTRQLRKGDGLLDFSLPAPELARKVRAFHPWPGAFALRVEDPARGTGQPLRILRARPLPGPVSAPPGAVLEVGGVPAVACGEGLLLLEEVQPPGKRPMPGQAYARGARDFIGGRLG
ncbi:MAG: methionyl-tRNA formyltransferase [Chloroflexi bacterium]|nr:methionyl-tRNA formyltransferase [Chloroflexota bacterium]